MNNIVYLVAVVLSRLSHARSSQSRPLEGDGILYKQNFNVVTTVMSCTHQSQSKSPTCDLNSVNIDSHSRITRTVSIQTVRLQYTIPWSSKPSPTEVENN